MIQPCPDLLYAESVPGLYDFTERLRIRIKSISQNMIFTLTVLAGELYAREELRVLLSQDILDDQTALEIVVVGDGEQFNSCSPDLLQNFIG